MKISGKMYIFLTDTLAKCHKIFLHIFPFQKYFGCGQGVDHPPPPAPFTDRSLTNRVLFISPSLWVGRKSFFCCPNLLVDMRPRLCPSIKKGKSCKILPVKICKKQKQYIFSPSLLHGVSD